MKSLEYKLRLSVNGFTPQYDLQKIGFTLLKSQSSIYHITWLHIRIKRLKLLDLLKDQYYEYCMLSSTLRMFYMYDIVFYLINLPRSKPLTQASRFLLLM
jgi:hypothetical protein